MREEHLAICRRLLRSACRLDKLTRAVQHTEPAMKFDEEHPRAFAHFTTGDGFIKGSGRASECVCCESPTTWFHKALGFCFCSRECHERYETCERDRMKLRRRPAEGEALS